ncbi:hypothetical protein QKC54_gp1005 [Megavirus baoshan]|uniref:Uncharacterized protein n=1 Tax=Megavirus baoshan TaxID=2496520 RepID=A0A8K1T2P3_9VIRU|nr:hypothetical protein QKC54_gp1005 [Megavirus baoshan]UFX99724.1 hypothetical protein Mb0067 [Megavirus baoshan]
MSNKNKIIEIDNYMYYHNNNKFTNYEIFVSTGLYPDTFQPSGKVNFNLKLKTIHHKIYSSNDKKK